MTQDAPSPSPLLSGRVALVTGATRGIGRAIAFGLAREGAHVIAVGRTQGALEELDDQILAATGERATLVPMDIASGPGVDQLGRAVFDRWGRLDILIAAAGVLGVTTPVPHMDPEVWDKVMAVNLTANYRLIRSLDPLLRAAPAGRAVFLTSGAARRPRAFWGAYAASKAGLDALAIAYADEVEHTPVRVAVANPGPMRTRMRAAAFPGEDPMTLPAPEEIVPMILELVQPGSDPKPQPIDFPEWKAARA